MIESSESDHSILFTFADCRKSLERTIWVTFADKLCRSTWKARLRPTPRSYAVYFLWVL